jgi:hypothetical protein
MGASESTLAVSADSTSGEKGNNTFVFKLYSRQFEPNQEVGPSDKMNLYLDDYGEEEETNTEPAPSWVDTPTVDAVEDLDYPVETMRAKLDVGEPVAHDLVGSPVNEVENPSHEEGITSAFENSRVERQSELNDRYPSLTTRTSPCQIERDDLMNCYKSNDDILNCREAVERYSSCAKNASMSQRRI